MQEHGNRERSHFPLFIYQLSFFIVPAMEMKNDKWKMENL